MASRIIVIDGTDGTRYEFTHDGEVSFERLRNAFAPPVRVTHDLVNDRWFVELPAIVAVERPA